MSSANILRLLRDALALNNERLDLVSGDVLKVRPNTDDTGSVNIGDGTYDMDVKVFLGSTTEYALFDVGNSQLDLQCPLAITGDLTVTGATAFTDTVVAAEHGIGAIGTALAPATSRRTVNGTIITEIKIDLTGLTSVATANDIIGLTGGSKPAYIGRNVVATNGIIYKIEMCCLEVPATGDTDIDLVSGSAADDEYDGAVTNAAIDINGGTWAAGTTVEQLLPAVTTNYYWYLTTGAGATAATYTAGQFLIRFYGHALLA
jgi:hypothetical protein